MKPKILYDSHCKVCRAEINYYKKQDNGRLFSYVDIMDSQFDASEYSLTKKQVHKYFHVIDENGNLLRGVDGFYYIWKKLDRLKLLQAIYNSRFGKTLMGIGYNSFVNIRPYLPREKNCEHSCKV